MHSHSTDRHELTTDRLLLRRWRPGDRPVFARINADARVAEFLAGPLSRAESDALVDRIESHFAEHGFGLWAVQLASDPTLIGFIGLSIPRFEAAFTPCVEIGWRLDPAHWCHGYATEGARAALRYGFDVVKLAEIVSFTAADNVRSRRVMERLGMRHDARDDFDHPRLPEGHPLRRHVLYRLGRAE